MSIIGTLLKSKFANEYEDADFPAQEKVSPLEKETPEYCRKVAQSGFAKLMKNRNSIPAASYDFIQLLRDYGSGCQSELYYKNKFTIGETGKSQSSTIGDNSLDNFSKNYNSRKREGADNINYKIVSVATNVKNAVHGMYDGYEEDIFVNAVDATAIAEEEKLMAEAYYDAKMREQLQSMEEKYGVPLTYDTFFPEDITPDELESYRETGGFKSKASEGIEQIIKHTEHISDWNRTIKRKFIDDFIDLNFIAARSVYNHETCKEQWEYMDPENFTIQYSDDRNFSDAEYAGYFTLEKISKLAQMGFDTNELKSASKKYQEYFNNNHRGNNWNAGREENKSELWWYDYKVPVYHHYWIETDVNRRLRIKNEYGKEVIVELDFDAEVRPLSQYRKKKGVEQEEYSTRIRNTYQCSFVVGTDIVYDFGKMPNQPRKSKRQPQLPVFAWKGCITNPKQTFGSITESVIPFYDQIQLAWLKYQDALVKSHPGGYAINIRMLQNLELGGKPLSPMAAFEMFWKTGKLPYMDHPLGESYKGGDVLPLKVVDGNMAQTMAPIESMISNALQFIERFSGVNMVLLGGTPAGTTTATETQISAAGSQNVLRPGIEGIFEIKEKLAYCSAKRAFLLIKYNDPSYEAYSDVVGTDITDLFRASDSFAMDYGLSMEARPSDEEVAEMLQVAQVAMQRGRDGEASINLSQYMWISEQLKSGGNVKMLRRQLDFMIRREQERLKKEKQENIMIQTQQQAQLEQQKAQAQAQLYQVDLQKSLAIENAKTQGDLQQVKLEADLELRNKQMENAGPDNKKPPFS